MWACDKFSGYLLGCTFLIETDHKPLVSLLLCKKYVVCHLYINCAITNNIALLGTKNFKTAYLRFRLPFSRFSYLMQHVPGKYLYTPDTLSCAPVSTANERDKAFQNAAEMFATVAVENLPAN